MVQAVLTIPLNTMVTFAKPRKNHFEQILLYVKQGYDPLAGDVFLTVLKPYEVVKILQELYQSVCIHDLMSLCKH